MALQETVFIRQAKMADAAGKPLIVHLVKATDALLRLKKELKPRVPWIIHGFRGKAQLAEELLRHGFYADSAFDPPFHRDGRKPRARGRDL